MQRPPRRLILPGIPSALRIGGLIPNPLVSAGDGPPVRLDAILAGRTAVLTARRPDAGLVDFCRRRGLVLVRISSSHAAGTTGGPAADPEAGWINVRLAGERRPAGLRALAVLGANPALTVVVSPDRVIAAVEPRCRLPRLPWPIPTMAEMRQSAEHFGIPAGYLGHVGGAILCPACRRTRRLAAPRGRLSVHSGQQKAKTRR